MLRIAVPCLIFCSWKSYIKFFDRIEIFWFYTFFLILIVGECDVDFATHADAEAAMKKDKQNMGKWIRYITFRSVLRTRYIKVLFQCMVNSSCNWRT